MKDAVAGVQSALGASARPRRPGTRTRGMRAHAPVRVDAPTRAGSGLRAALALSFTLACRRTAAGAGGRARYSVHGLRVCTAHLGADLRQLPPDKILRLLVGAAGAEDVSMLLGYIGAGQVDQNGKAAKAIQQVVVG